MGIQKDIIEAEVRLKGMSESQRQLVELSSAYGTLAEKNKSLKIRMLELEAEGKKGSEAWKQLRDEMKKNTTEMGVLDAKMGVLNSKLKYSEMTHRQLQKAQKDLQRELSRTSKELQPEKWAELDKKMKDVELQMGKTTAGATAAQKWMGNMTEGFKSLLPVAGLWGGIAAGLALIKSEILSTWELSKVIQGDAIRSSVVLGDQLGYVEIQADKLAKKMGLTNREFVAATAATADLLVPLGFTREASAKMATQVTSLAGALNEWTGGQYGVEEVSKRLQKAVLGETDSLKELGIGIRLDSEEYRKSVKHKMEVLKVTQEQAQAMTIMEMLYQKSTDAQAAYERGGNVLIRTQQNVTVWFKKMKESVANYIATTADQRLLKSAESIAAQGKEMETTNKKIEALLSRYAELKKIIKPTADQQSELNTVIKQLSDFAPGAITQVDAYGKAMGVSADKVREAMEAHRLLNLEMNKDVVKKMTGRLKGKLDDMSDYKEYADKQLQILKSKDGTWEKGMRFVLNNVFHVSNEKIKSNGEKALAQHRANLANANKEAAQYILMLKENGKTISEIAKEAGVPWTKLDAIVKSYMSTQSKVLGEDADGNPKTKIKPNPDTPEKVKDSYSLGNDLTYQKEQLAMRQQFRDGDIADEEAYNEKLLNLDIKYLTARLAKGKEKGIEKTRLEKELVDKEIELKELGQKRSEKLQNANNKADVESIEAYFAEKTKLYEDDLYNMQLAHQKELDAVGNNQQERKALLEKQKKEEQALAKAYMDKMLELLNQLLSTGALPDLKLMDKIMSDGEREATVKNIEAVAKALKELQKEMNKKPDDSSDKDSKKTPTREDVRKAQKEKTEKELALEVTPLASFDILGYTEENWAGFFNNLNDGVHGINEMSFAAQALMNIWQSYGNLMTQIENRQLQNIEKSNNKKKAQLKKQLDSKTITEKQYNDRVAQMDKELDDKKAELQVKQARREKALGIMGAIVNTAVGVSKALSLPWPLNLVMAAVVAAMGAVQIATIASTPLPGKATGGFLVQREQDGKYFDAEFQPKKRGFVSKPTVIVGEEGDEWVANNAAVKNPTIAPILSIFDEAQRNGSIATLDMNRVMADRFSGRASGGSIGGGSIPAPAGVDSTLVDVLKKSAEVTEMLEQRLRKPIPALVSMTGKEGLNESIARYNDWKEDVNL